VDYHVSVVTTKAVWRAAIEFGKRLHGRAPQPPFAGDSLIIIISRLVFVDREGRATLNPHSPDDGIIWSNLAAIQI
jgi:hypothetical protein